MPQIVLSAGKSEAGMFVARVVYKFAALVAAGEWTPPKE
jgi:hypothetical protein